jgi:hypothetical protein
MPATKKTARKTPTKRQGGRPSLFTETSRHTYVQAVKLGAAPKIAAQAAGWSQRLAQEYMRRGRHLRAVDEAHELEPADHPPLTDQEAEFVRFLRDVEEADADAGRGALAAIVRAAQKGTWQAAAWLLERRWPEDYGRRTQVEMAGPDGGPLQVEITAADLLAQLEQMTSERQQIDEWQRSRTGTPAAKVVSMPPPAG